MKVAGECWRAPARNRAWSIHNRCFHIFPRLASASEVWQLVKLEAVSWPLLCKWPGETPRRSKEWSCIISGMLTTSRCPHKISDSIEEQEQIDLYSQAKKNFDDFGFTITLAKFWATKRAASKHSQTQCDPTSEPSKMTRGAGTTCKIRLHHQWDLPLKLCRFGQFVGAQDGANWRKIIGPTNFDHRAIPSCVWPIAASFLLQIQEAAEPSRCGRSRLVHQSGSQQCLWDAQLLVNQAPFCLVLLWFWCHCNCGL